MIDRPPNSGPRYCHWCWNALERHPSDGQLLYNVLYTPHDLNPVRVHHVCVPDALDGGYKKVCKP